MDQLLLPIILIGALVVVMYFSSKKRKKMLADDKAMKDSIVPGTRIMTTSGLHATVTAMADDTVELEIAPGVRTTWIKAAIREVVVPVLDEPLDGFEDDYADLGDDTDSDQTNVDLRKKDLG
ncbi:preprotein translocase subunit YajC [Nakamurella antarctica]|uniref:Preprotein translocase subunit YajC n=1 Tax=Nakamurella antarctica TaxID=1902245 RepID=A0A3G8ZK78_9ACTN|nr:preprotein translocase subunit YajC [Nakamurella antarctica]AZI57729.1 preprotein translocase subunit YajC [Nakamurella antarctica]